MKREISFGISVKKSAKGATSLVLAGLLLAPLPSFGVDSSSPPIAGVQASTGQANPIVMDVQLKEVRAGLELALQAAELSLAPHTPGSGHTKNYMKQVLSLLQGETKVSEAQAGSSETDKPGLIATLEGIQQTLKKNAAPPAMSEAIESALAYLNEAAREAQLSIMGTGVQKIHGPARLATGLLVAALGRQDSTSPVSGALAFASRTLASIPR